MIKRNISRIPVLGPAIVNSYRAITGAKPSSLAGSKPFSSGDYWEQRYQRGGTSGAGSYGNLANFKADVINEFVTNHNVETVIEFGCGDGNQLQQLEFSSYLGLDISPSAIERCRDLNQDQPCNRFELLSAYDEEEAELTLSLDVVYHLTEDSVYQRYMKQLFSASSKFVMVYSSNHEDLTPDRWAKHVRHRKFTNWTDLNCPGFEQIAHIPNKHPFDGTDNTSFADFYIFARI